MWKVQTRLKGYKYFEIERDFFNKLGVLIDEDFKFGVLLLAFVRFLGGDTGNLYRNGFLQRVNVSPLFLFPLNSFNFKIFISFQTGFHTYSAQPFY
jgi:hypothetical protein